MVLENDTPCSASDSNLNRYSIQSADNSRMSSVSSSSLSSRFTYISALESVKDDIAAGE